MSARNYKKVGLTAILVAIPLVLMVLVPSLSSLSDYASYSFKRDSAFVLRTLAASLLGLLLALYMMLVFRCKDTVYAQRISTFCLIEVIAIASALAAVSEVPPFVTHVAAPYDPVVQIATIASYAFTAAALAVNRMKARRSD